MIDCLIGYSGLVGSTLMRQGSFPDLRNSKNFRAMRGQSYGTVTCCGVSAAKWLANKEPEEDLRKIAELADVLAEIKAERFVLISTVDVYSAGAMSSGTADEAAEVGGTEHHAYGRNRAWLEGVVRDLFPSTHHIIRLPALFGPSLKKNVLFDMAHGRLLAGIDPAAEFQWYDLLRLGRDISTVVEAGVPLINLVTPPISTGVIAQALFPGIIMGADTHENRTSPRYDVRTCHAGAFGSPSPYMMTQDAVMAGLKAWSARPDRVGPNPDQAAWA